MIVPYGESAKGLKLVVLDGSFLNTETFLGRPRYRDLHNKNLVFKPKGRLLRVFVLNSTVIFDSASE